MWIQQRNYHFILKLDDKIFNGWPMNHEKKYFFNSENVVLNHNDTTFTYEAMEVASEG